MLNKYRLYNETKGIWEFVISDEEPTVLPDNPTDTLRAGSVSITVPDIRQGDGTKIVASLPNYKGLRYIEIDKRTGELISAGFTYATKQFSLSLNAQINISALNQSKDLLTYPVNYNTLNDEDEYDVIDATDMGNMYMTALATKKGMIDSGTALKQQIRAAIDEAGVDAVIDNR